MIPGPFEKTIDGDDDDDDGINLLSVRAGVAMQTFASYITECHP